jgi:RNA polymerase sigma factor (sigma-70 family)
MLRIVTNCCRMERRRRHAPQTALDDLEEDTLPADGSDALAGMLREKEAAAVARVMKSLPDAQQRVLELRYQADLELAEISLVLDLPLGTVKSRLHRALSTIRQRYERTQMANVSPRERR